MLLLNNQPIDHFLFSGGEFQVKLPHKIDTERAILTWKPIDASEITFLALAVNALKHMGIWDIDLDVLYLPYARQDRVCSPGEAHSLEVMCHFLDNLGLTTIRIWDVHNEEKTEELFPNTTVCFVTATNVFDRYHVLDDFDTSNLILCAPDDGAYGRVIDLCNYFDFAPPVSLHKVRCHETGRITNMNLDKYMRNIESYNILIIDDICDGGATFNQAAQVLKEHGAVNLYLYVTHGIFSKGLDLLQENFKHIICHHVLHDDKFQSTDRLTILQEHPYVP
jgi:ribose-phosphate pyrophosphokinase